MLTHLAYLRNRLRSSFWLMPGALTAAGVGAALAMLWLDSVEPDLDALRWAAPFAVGADGARLVLSTIAGSMITVASLVFSMTLVALTLAASNIGPRLLDRYISNRVNQVALGLFLATFVYSLIVLRAVIDDDSLVFVPHLSVSLAMVLAILSFGLLIAFLHELATSIQVDNTVARVAGELIDALRRLPDDGASPGDPSPARAGRREIRAGMPHTPVAAGVSGYIQAVDAAALVDIAQEHDAVIEMVRRPGHFVIPTIELARVRGAAEVDERLADRIRGCVILGPKRTAAQDLEFSVTQLVEVAARALSPGINDFYTAIACVDHLTAALALALEKGLPSNPRHDDAGRLRVELYPLAFQDLADAALDPIRQAAADNVAVSIRLLESLTMLATCASGEPERRVLAEHGELVRASALQAIKVDRDRDDVQARFAALQGRLQS
jgi:uncharacterized membrane protein